MKIIQWVESTEPLDRDKGAIATYELMVGEEGDADSLRSAGTVWHNGKSGSFGEHFVWHTWDEDAVGGENDTEERRTLAETKLEVVMSAFNQGFLQ